MRTLNILTLKASALFMAMLIVSNINLRAQAAGPVQDDPEGPKYMPGQVLVKFRADVTDDQIADAFRTAGLGLLKHILTPSMETNRQAGVTHASTGVPVAQAVKLLSRLPGIEFAQPNWVYSRQDVSDPYFANGSLWGMYGTATTPANQFGSQAAAAWASGAAGSKTVYIGIIDQGIQFAHPDLAANIWSNPLELNGLPNVDDDKNGYVDDIHGWNAIANNGQVYDGTDDHGTHVAGTIGADQNGIGVAGVNWDVNLISGKFLDSDGYGTTADAIQAIDYMTHLKMTQGINIVALNNSWSGGGYDPALFNSIVNAAKAEILIVAAAGNGDWRNRAMNTDNSPVYPACYNTTTAAGYDAVISVTAINSSGARPSFANYGLTTVDLGAPGVGIWSTVPVDAYASYNGTSMATPHVTGAIALYAAKYPGTKAKDIRNALLANTTATSSLSSTVTKGRLDIVEFLADPPPDWNPSSEPPAAPSGLTATGISFNQVTLTWVDNSNNETSFVITRSSSAETVTTTVTVPANLTTFADTGVKASTTYTYSIKACKEEVNCSSDSPTFTVTTPAAPALAEALFKKQDDTTKGNWIGVYGNQGYNIIKYKQDPSYAQVTFAGYWLYDWATSTTDPRALLNPSKTSRFASCYNSASSFTIDVSFSDTATHRVTLYCLDWDPGERNQTIRILDRNTGILLSEVLVDNFSGGRYLTWDITGSVRIEVVYRSSGPTSNAVVSGIFFDDPTFSPSVPTAPGALKATAVSSSQINLSWIDASSNETGFTIERSLNQNFSSIDAAVNVGANTTSYSSKGLKSRTTYYYRVGAFNGSGNGGYSNTASAKTR